MLEEGSASLIMMALKDRSLHKIRLGYACALALLVSACSGHKGFVGTWKRTDSNAGSKSSFTFNADHTMSFTASNGPKQTPYTLTGLGTWSATQKELTVTPLSMDLEGLPAQQKQMLWPYLQKQINVPQTGPIEWKNDDEFVLTKDKIQQVFDRVN